MARSRPLLPIPFSLILKNLWSFADLLRGVFLEGLSQFASGSDTGSTRPSSSSFLSIDWRGVRDATLPLSHARVSCSGDGEARRWWRVSWHLCVWHLLDADRRLGAVETGDGGMRRGICCWQRAVTRRFAMLYRTRGEVVPAGGTSTETGVPHSSGPSSSPFATGGQLASRWPLVTGAPSPHASCFGGCRTRLPRLLWILYPAYIARSRVSRRGSRRRADVRLLHRLHPLAAIQLMTYHRSCSGHWKATAGGLMALLEILGC